MIVIMSSQQEIYSIAPGENKHPVSFMLDKQCEELVFPLLFPKGRYGYTTERQVAISRVKYFMLDFYITVEGLSQTLNTSFLHSS